METDIILKSLKFYQRQLNRQIECHGFLSNEAIQEQLIKEVRKVEADIDRIKNKII